MEESHLLPELRVEGMNDFHTVMHLLREHGIECFDAKIPKPTAMLHVKQEKDSDSLLSSIKPAVEFRDKRPLGFIFDADSSPESRWQSVSDRLAAAGVEVPGVIPLEGFIGHSAKNQVRVGAWMMPDNVSAGMIEDFLRRLIDEKDALIQFAVEATDRAENEFGAKFVEVHRSKARIHTWLAWQRDPGRPFGVAVKAGYFQKNAALALSLVDWVRELCQM